MHVDYLSRELAKMMEVDVRTFDHQSLNTPNLKVRGFPVDTSKFGCPKNLQSIFGAVSRCLDFNTVGIDADVVHCHTWYPTVTKNEIPSTRTNTSPDKKLGYLFGEGLASDPGPCDVVW